MKQWITLFREEGWGRFLLTGAAVALAVWLAAMAGLFLPLDGLLYDLVVNTSIDAGLSVPPARVMLVEIPPSSPGLDEQSRLRLLQTFSKYNPRLILFNFFQGDISLPELKRIRDAASVPVVFGVLAANENGAGVISGRDWQTRIQPFQDAGIDVGAVGLPASGFGIYRHQHASFALGDGGDRVRALEVAATRLYSSLREKGKQSKQSPSSPSLPVQDYFVRFRGEPGSLPRVSLDRVLQDDLVAQLVAGRCILVGRGRDSGTPGLYTPTTSRDESPMSLLEFQGHALNTLINDLDGRTRVVSLGVGLKLSIFLLITLTSLPLYHRLFMRMASWLTLLLLVGYLGLAYGAFLFLAVWLPVGEMLILQAILFISSIQSKNVTADRGFQDLLMDMNGKLRERYYPTSIYRVKEHWAQVIAMVTQTLSLNRLIFLERVPGDHRVREVESFNCSFSDIDERRRDFHRFPYSEAIKSNGPLLVSEKRPYLRVDNREEEQYLVPLGFGGDILGFWAFGVRGNTARSIPDFLTLIRDYAFIIGELLYNRQEIQSRESRGGKLLHYLAIEREQEAYRALKQTIAFLKRRFDNLANLFNGLTSHTIVYDLFGRVLEANQGMLALLKDMSLAPYDLTSTDLVSRMTGMSRDETQQMLRRVINNRKTISFMVELREKHYTLHLRPLEFNASTEDLLDPSPFGISGIVCELVETTSMVEIHEMKEQLATQLSGSVAVQLDELLALVDTLEPIEEDVKVLSACKAKIHNMTATIERCQAFISKTTDLRNYEQAIPVNPMRSIRLALEHLKEAAREQQVTFDTALDDFPGYVHAMTGFLRHVFEHILIILIKDTAQKGTVYVRMEQEDDWVRTTIHNQPGGMGIPGEKLQDQLFGPDEAIATKMSPDMRNMRESVEWIRSWGGVLEVESELGQGTRFVLDLARFT